MPKFNQTNRTTDLSALLSDSVVVTTWRGRTVISKKPSPKKRKKNSPKQQQSITSFRRAHEYAARVFASDEERAMYAKGITARKTSAHMVALQDYLNPPTVHYIKVNPYTGKPGEVISVKATDDFHVASVTIEIYSAKGKLIEKGNAERYARKPSIWKYKTVVANKTIAGTRIEVTAKDLPGNECAMKWRVGEG